jgi:hypothetical protein
MKELADELDKLGFFKEADQIDNIFIKISVFNLKKKKKTPLNMLEDLQRSVAGLQSQVSEVNDAMDFSDEKPKQSLEVMVENKPVEVKIK